jgi:hypothetical protein
VINEFISFILYEWPGADDTPFFCVGVSTAVSDMRKESASRYCLMIAGLIPAHFKFEPDHSIADLSDEELRARLLELRAKLLDPGLDPSLLGPPPDAPQSGRDGPKRLPARPRHRPY